MSRSGSSSARARPLLSITEEAATSRGVEPLIAGEATTQIRVRDVNSALPSFAFQQSVVQTAGGSVSTHSKTTPAANLVRVAGKFPLCMDTYIRLHRVYAAVFMCGYSLLFFADKI